MAKNKFDKKNAEQVLDILFAGEGEITTQQIDGAFEELNQVKPEIRAQAINLLEEEAVVGVVEIVEEIRPEMVVARKMREAFNQAGMGSTMDDLYNSSEDADEVIRGVQRLCGMMHHISNAKGDKVHPVIKATLNEISKLSDKEYNSFLGLYEALERAYDSTVGAAAVKPNPFRPKGPGA